MSDIKEALIGEINGMLDSIHNAGTLWHPKLITQAVVSKRYAALDREHDDSAFWEIAGYEATRKLVREVINKRTGDDGQGGDLAQLDLPGLEAKRLQAYYLVKRDGDWVGVPVMAMTDAEIDAKSEYFASLATANAEHHDELQRFKRWRAEHLGAANLA